MKKRRFDSAPATFDLSVGRQRFIAFGKNPARDHRFVRVEGGRELKAYSVTSSAYDRGYGTPREIVVCSSKTLKKNGPLPRSATSTASR